MFVDNRKVFKVAEQGLTWKNCRSHGSVTAIKKQMYVGVGEVWSDAFRKKAWFLSQIVSEVILTIQIKKNSAASAKQNVYFHYCINFITTFHSCCLFITEKVLLGNLRDQQRWGKIWKYLWSGSRGAGLGACPCDRSLLSRGLQCRHGEQQLATIPAWELDLPDFWVSGRQTVVDGKLKVAAIFDTVIDLLSY